ncbi:hypothetical protein EZY14_004555 [Kordia sp. TARA_039_SRF]|nr:hypothetical protein EZY14_004555 [Kordia sp. TARA_039_SRF]
MNSQINSYKKHIVYTFLLLISTLNVLFAQASKKIDWKKDLEVYKVSLEQKHINLYHSVTKEEFLEEWNSIYNNLNSLSDAEIILKLMRLTRRVQDGHTSVSLRNMSTHRYPFEVEYISNKWHIVKISKEHKSVLNSSLIAIDDVPIKEVSTKVSKVAQFVENKYSQVVRTGSYMNISEVLHALNITNKKQEATFTFIDASNKKTKITLNALEADASNFVHQTIGVPEITKPNNPKFPYLWFAPIKNTQAIYIHFESYPPFTAMQNFGETVVNYISQHQIKNVIIDMRNNGGGDLYVGTILAYALNLADSVDWENGVFVLTSNKTFSAGTSNTALFQQLLNAKVVGQPTGSNPTGYQDMDEFTLPNSKLIITYSKRKFNLSNTVTQGIQPDVQLNYNWNDYREGKDNILQWVIKQLK